MEAHVWNSNTWEAEARGYHEFEASLGYLVSSRRTVTNTEWKPFIKEKKKEKEK